MSEPTFDQRVRETAFAGETDTKLDALLRDVTEIRSDMKHVRTQVDRWGGAVALISACLSAIVSVAVALFRP